MKKVIRFAHHLRVYRTAPDYVVLVGERERFVLRGRAYGALTPLIDGQRTIEQLIQALDPQLPGPEVYLAITTLTERGYVTEVDADWAPGAAAFWGALGASPHIARQRLTDAPVMITALGAQDPALVRDTLEAAGIRVAPQAAIHLVATSDYLAPEVSAIHREARTHDRRWMLVAPGAIVPWIGPMFQPGAGACWQCLAYRLRYNRPVESFVERRLAGTAVAPPPAHLRASARLALDLAAVALARWIVDGGRGAIDDKLLAVELDGLRITEHTVVHRPECADCGSPALYDQRARLPISLQPTTKVFTDDGGHRARSPADTVARYAHLVSSITGVVTALGPIEGRDHPLRAVWFASLPGHPAADAPEVDEFQRGSLGKGRTAIQARASALCEALERHSGLYRGDEPRIRARLADLGEDAIDPRSLFHFSEAEYRARTADVPPPFDAQMLIDWTPVWSLTHQRRRYLPTSYCYFNTPSAGAAWSVPCNSNGHAAGNCLEEAILQGFLELVERDACALWWYSRARRPGVDLRGFGEPYFETLRDHYEGLGWQLWALDLTSDLGIPSFIALARESTTGRFTAGFGSHGEARLGVQRALTELNQLFDPGGQMPAPWDASALEDADFLRPSASVAPRVCQDFAEERRDDLAEDVRACVARAARAGLETLVLDQTRPDIGLPVVKVVVPGLRHLRPARGPGRLYDVPVQLGWVDQRLREDQLNPVALFA